MYVQIDPKLVEAHLKRGSCVVRKLKYNRIKRKRKQYAR